MKKFLIVACCSLFLFTGCGNTSYFQSTEMVDPEGEAESKEQVIEDVMPESIYVQVAGAVTSPDVYELPVGSRVYAALDAAGGLLDSADDSELNLASPLEDGQKIYVYTVEEMEARAEELKLIEEAAVDDGLININTASALQLQALPGIGESKANQIVSYREANGEFSSLEDIKKVSGIGDGIFNQINSLIKL